MFNKNIKMNKDRSAICKWSVCLYILFLAFLTWNHLLSTLPLLAATNNPTLNFPLAFSEPVQLQRSVNGISTLIVADLNNDFAADLVAATDQSNEIFIYENDGRGGFPNWTIAQRATSHISDLHAADLDEDGDIDLLVAQSEENQVGWFENFGKGNWSTMRRVSQFTSGVSSVYSADLDGDGDTDILSASELDNKIAWYTNLDDADNLFGGQQTITTEAMGATDVYAADLDQDGDIDIISASASDDSISWYENRGVQEKTGFGKRRTIAANADGAQSIAVADLDGDGDPDILSASQENNTIAWYENRLTEATEDFKIRAPISTDTNGANSVYVADMDRDNDMDVLATALGDSQITWYMNLDGAGTFGQKRIIASNIEGAAGVYTADLDGDGDQDVISAALMTQNQRAVMAANGEPDVISASAINWHRNEIPDSCSGYQRIDTILDSPSFEPGGTEWGDFDNDGDIDLLITGFDDISRPLTQIYRNDAGTFNAVFKGLEGIDASDISWGDYDNDNDLDILVIGLNELIRPTARIYRNESTDVDGPSFVEIDAELTGVDAGSAVWGDYDRDGHLDILLMGLDADRQPLTQLYRNLDNSSVLSNTARFQPIETNFPNLYNGSAAWGDYDGNGTLDLLIAGTQQSADPITRLYRHDRDNMTQASTFVDILAPLTAVREASVAWGDYDNDGNSDILISGISRENRPIAKVYHNTYKTSEYPFKSAGAGLAHAIQSSALWLDRDQDGDLDILLIGNGDEGEPVTRVYENQGNGLFKTLEFEDLGLPIGAILWADYDGDGDDDLLVAAKDDNQIGVTGLTIYRNEGCIDVNLVNNDHDPVNLRAGSNIRYTLSYSNEGNRVAKSVVLTEVVPINTTFNITQTEAFISEQTVSGQDIKRWNYTGITAGSVFTMSLGDLEPGIGGAVEFWVTLDTPLPLSTYVITNHAVLNFDDVNNIEVDRTNNQSTEYTPVGRASIAGLIWEDDGDGIQELEEEVALVNANILFRTSLTGTVIYSTTTNEDGVFVADSLLYGEYVVSCVHERCPFDNARARVDEVSATTANDFSASPYRLDTKSARTMQNQHQSIADDQTVFLVHFNPGVTRDVAEKIITSMDAEMVEWLSQIYVAEIRADNMAKVLSLKHEAIESIEIDQSIGQGSNFIGISNVLGTNDGYIPDDPDSVDKNVSYAPQHLQVIILLPA